MSKKVLLITLLFLSVGFAAINTNLDIASLSIVKQIDDFDVYFSDAKINNVSDVTIVKTHYAVGNDEGTLAIIGPKRMEYDKVVTLLNFLKNYIEK